MAISILVVLATLVAAFVAARYALLRTCSNAFRQGFADARNLDAHGIKERFAGFLRPMRPMDAAAYVRGVRCALRTGMDPSQARREFARAFRSGKITRDGTSIRQLGAEEALRDFRLPGRRSRGVASS
jgi:hypothetical protein